MMKKTKYQLNILDSLKLLESIPVEWDSQLSVKSRTGNDFFDGIGSINDYKNVHETDFDKINEFFLNTDIERILNELKQDGYDHGRVRLMKMKPKSVYSYHMDCEPRLHFALQTNPNAMMIVDDNVIRIPSDGFGYWVDTTKYHTALNASKDEIRIHLVIDLLIPVKQINGKYIVLNKELTQQEFENWLIETKPITEPARQDYYFI